MTENLTDAAVVPEEIPEEIELYRMIKDSNLPVVLDINKTQDLVDAMLVRGSMIMYDIMTDDQAGNETRIKADTAILKYADHIEKRLNKPKEQEDLVDDM